MEALLKAQPAAIYGQQAAADTLQWKAEIAARESVKKSR